MWQMRPNVGLAPFQCPAKSEGQLNDVKTSLDAEARRRREYWGEARKQAV
jgi:hypothetical protein